MDVYRVWQYGVRQRLHVQKLNEILVTAYRTVRNITVSVCVCVIILCGYNIDMLLKK